MHNTAAYTAIPKNDGLRPRPLPDGCSVSEAKCEWREDQDGTWWTECDEGHQFTTDGPVENNHRYCPYCGSELVPVSFQGEEEE